MSRRDWHPSEDWRGLSLFDAAADSVALEVTSRVIAQENKGRAKYGALLAAQPLAPPEVAEHAIQEATDLLVYLIDLKRRVDPPVGDDLLSRAHVHANAHRDSRDIIMELCAAIRAAGCDA